MEKSNLAAVVEAKKPAPSPCLHCRYSATADDQTLQCRRNPPLAQPLFENTQGRGPRLIGTYTYFPAAVALCGEFYPADGAAISDLNAGKTIAKVSE